MPIDIYVYPNPFDCFINIEVTCAEEKEYIILLADIQQSKIVKMMGAGLGKGVNKIPLDDLQSLELGTYDLFIKNKLGESVYETRLFKQ